MIVWAFDVGIKTGWAIRTDKGKLYSGRKNFWPNRTKDYRYMLTEVPAFLDKLKSKFGTPDLIAFENACFQQGMATKRYHSILAHVEAWTVSQGRFVKMMPLAVTTIKKHATGNGHAKKPEMMEAARKRGWDFKNDDEADALWIMNLALKN